MIPFVAFLALTVLHLCAVVWTGMKGRRTLHLVLVADTVLMLAVTIYFAEKLGEQYDLEAAGAITPIHLTLAKVTTVAYLLPVVTGVRLLRNPARRPAHRRMAFLVLGLTVVTFLTGTWMILAATPLAG